VELGRVVGLAVAVAVGRLVGLEFGRLVGAGRSDSLLVYSSSPLSSSAKISKVVSEL
jgi:hypothetical protein